jgi:hypothetical protein
MRFDSFYRLPRWSWLLGLMALGSSCGAASSRAASAVPPDAAETDPDKYQLLLDNPLLRVLRYSDTPGTKTHSHHHPCFVLYALAPFKRRLTFPDGSRKEREFQVGDVVFLPEQTHVGENIGSTPSSALLIELKSGCASSDSRK